MSSCSECPRKMAAPHALCSWGQGRCPDQPDASRCEEALDGGAPLPIAIADQHAIPAEDRIDIIGQVAHRWMTNASSGWSFRTLRAAHGLFASRLPPRTGKPLFTDGWDGGADETRTRDLRRDRPAF